LLLRVFCASFAISAGRWPDRGWDRRGNI